MAPKLQIPLAPERRIAKSSRDKSSSTSATASCSNANSTESSNEASESFPSLSLSDIYPTSLRESYVEHLICTFDRTEVVGFWRVRQSIDGLKGVCTMGGLRRTLRRYYKEDFVRRVGKYYRDIGAFETDAQMVKFMDWYFNVRGVLLREVALYIVERSFLDHVEAIRFGKGVEAGVEGSSRKEVGRTEKGKGRESEGEGGDEKNGNLDGRGGGRSMEIGGVLWAGLRIHAATEKAVLDIDPIRVTLNQDHSQHDVNWEKVASDQNPPPKRFKSKRLNETDKFQELLLQITNKYSPAITAQLSPDWQHNVDLNNISQSTGLLYHATTRSNLSTLKFEGIEPHYFARSQLSTGEALNLENSLPECILNVLLKKPQLERIIPDPVAVLSFEVETGLLEHVADRKAWVVLDLNDHHLHELQEIVIRNLTGTLETLFIEEEDNDCELTGAVVPVDLVIGPWLMPIPLPGSAKIHKQPAFERVEAFQFAFTSHKSWDFLQKSYHAVSGRAETTMVPFLADHKSVSATVSSTPGICRKLNTQSTLGYD